MSSGTKVRPAGWARMVEGWNQGPFGGKKNFYIERTVDFTKLAMSTAPWAVKIDSG